jgi:hypothetical protein
VDSSKSLDADLTGRIIAQGRTLVMMRRLARLRKLARWPRSALPHERHPAAMERQYTMCSRYTSTA